MLRAERAVFYMVIYAGACELIEARYAEGV